MLNKNHSLAPSTQHNKPMESKVLPHHHLCPSKPSTPFIIVSHISLQPPLRGWQTLKATRPTITSSSTEEDGNSSIPSSAPKPVIPKTDRVEIRYRRGARKRSKEKQMDNSSGGGGGRKRPSPPKDWESMTVGEKAVELYMGEKGALFWLNKFAYASIYIVIGAWILFRFVGPSLGLYQLDAPPLSPTAILK